MEAKIPVSLTVHLTGEYFLLSQFPQIQGCPKTLSVGQYGLHRGLGRVLDVAKERGIPCTFFVTGAIAQQSPHAIAAIADGGHEIANHGWEHENFAILSYDEQAARLAKTNAVLRDLTGQTPVGFRAPMAGDFTADTLRALNEAGFAYSSSCYDDDEPYFAELDGQATKLVEIPVKWTLYDLPYFLLSFTPAFPTGQSRVAQYTQVLNNWKVEYEGAERFQLPYILQVDTQTIAKPGRIGLLEEILDFIQSRGTGAFSTMRDMASSFAAQHAR